MHAGSARKSSKSLNPHSKQVNMQPYRDVNAHNTWLLSNIFVAMGNYLFWVRCLCSTACFTSATMLTKRSEADSISNSNPRDVEV